MNKSPNARKTALETCQRRLEASEARFRNTIENNVDGILIVDTDGVVRFANPAAASIFGREADKLLQEDFGFPVVVGDKVEVDLIPRDGEPIIAEMRVSETKWEGEICHLVSLRDITERKQAEERTSHLNHVLRAIRDVNHLIAREKDRDRLLQGICEKLVEARGYYNVWIALMDDKNRVSIVAEAGLGETFHPLLQQLRQEKWPHCVHQVLNQKEVLAIKEPLDVCRDCPLAENYGDKGALSIRLQHGDDIYGVLTASTPKKFIVDEEEHTLFEELAGDIALALHSITLEEQHKELEKIINRSQAVAFLWRAAEGWPVEYVSDNVEQFGYTPDDFYSGCVNFTDIIHPDDLERVSKEVARHRQSGTKQFTQGYRIVSKSGEVHWVDDRTWVRHNAEGEITHYEGIILDVTERKQTEEALQKSEKKYKSYIDNAPDAVFVANAKGRYIEVNQAACQITGYSEQEMLSMHVQDLIAPQAQEAARQHFLRVKENGKASGQFPFVRKDGTQGYWSVEAVKLSESRMLGFTKDITERRRAEEKLRLRNAAIATSINAIAMFDLEGHLTYINDAFLELWGYDSRERMMQQTPQSFWHQPEQIEAAIEAIEDKGHWRGELIAQQRDGDTFNVQAAISLVTRNGGDPIAIMASFLDITERRRMEEALRESEERFRSIVEQSHDGIVLMNQKGRIIEWNKGQEQIMGLKREAVLGRFMWDVQHQVALEEKKKDPEFYDRLKGQITRHLEDNQVSWPRELSEREVQRPDGTHRIVQASVFPIQTRGGTLVSSIIRDITAQRRMEERLRKLSRAVEQSPSAVVITDTRGNIEYVNPKFTRVTGYSPHEAIGRNPRILKSGHQSPEFYEDLWDTITAGEEWRGEFCNRKKNGEVYWELASISPIRNGAGNTTHYLKVAEDVTARREMEEALRHSEQRYRTVFDHAGDAIFVHDMEGQFLDVNQIACERLGYSRDELLGMSPTDITVPDIEQLQKVDQLVFETTQVRRDGTSFPVEINSRYIEYDGQPAILSIARDITKRKAIEEKIERYAADLERSNQELEQFAYVVSHDLQEPLRMVKSYMELLERRYREQLDEKANMFIDYAVDGAQRMQEMIKGMLDLSRIGTRGDPLAPTDVEAILERTLKILGRTIEETGAEITHDPLPTVMADKAQLAQVFQNLVANGIKFRREDVPPRVHISAERADDEWLFSVEDNGIGIDPKQSDRIFQVFQRLHTQEEYEGTGIGLALCKRIVERHGGRIWVESKPGEGSTFKFTIPVQTEES